VINAPDGGDTKKVHGRDINALDVLSFDEDE
jgi:hypothetical protein